MTQFNWGVLGPGNIAHQFAQALSTSEHGQLYAVASRNASRAQHFADQYSAQVIYHNYADMLADPKVDFVYIATPHSLHFEHAVMTLQAGKHLLMEKPLTVNAAQTAKLIQLAEQNQVVFQEALWSRFMPCFAQVRSWLQEGQIGDLQYIQSQIGFSRADQEGHRLTTPELAGGALLDLGVYSISLSQFLVGENPIEIHAFSQAHKTGVDQNTSVNLRFPNGVLSQFVCTIGAEASNTMFIQGSKGSIELPSMFWNGTQATLKKGQDFEQEMSFPHPVNGFEYQIEASMQCAQQGRLCSEVMNHADSLAVMQCMDEVRRQIGLDYGAELESCEA